MKTSADLAPLLEAFFTRRLIGQLRLSPHTIASYRDTFRLMLSYAQKRLQRCPSDLAVSDLDTKFISEFLDDLEKNRTNSPRSRNLRLAAIRSFFRYAALEAPQHSALIQRVLAIPRKRHSRPLIGFLARPEIEALLSVVDRHTWIGQRDYALLLVAIQTGLRLSELTGLRQQDVCLATGPHIRCDGKGRKERCTPLTKATAAVLGYWMKLQNADESQNLFPSTRGGRLSADAVQRLVQKYVGDAQKVCPSLARKQVTPHVLRHTAAMEMLQSGVDRSLIAIWLGHESVETTQIYLDANLPLKEEILAKTSPVKSKLSRFRASDRLLNFLKNL
jgi:integrase/recombinase XerD